MVDIKQSNPNFSTPLWLHFFISDTVHLPIQGFPCTLSKPQNHIDAIVGFVWCDVAGQWRCSTKHSFHRRCRYCEWNREGTKSVYDASVLGWDHRITSPGGGCEMGENSLNWLILGEYLSGYSVQTDRQLVPVPIGDVNEKSRTMLSCYHHPNQPPTKEWQEFLWHDNQ